VLSWTLAGGICGGGLLIGALTMFDSGSAGLHLLLAPVLFILGTILGSAHALVLSVAGRPADVPRRDALRSALFVLALSLPLIPVSWLVSSSIAVATALRTEMRASWLAVVAGGTAIGLAVCGWACVEAGRVVRSARRRMRSRGTTSTNAPSAASTGGEGIVDGRASGPE